MGRSYRQGTPKLFGIGERCAATRSDVFNHAGKRATGLTIKPNDEGAAQLHNPSQRTIRLAGRKLQIGYRRTKNAKGSGSVSLNGSDQAFALFGRLDPEGHGENLAKASEHGQGFGTAVLLHVATHQALVQLLCQIIGIDPFLIEQHCKIEFTGFLSLAASPGDVAQELAANAFAHGQRPRRFLVFSEKMAAIEPPKGIGLRCVHAPVFFCNLPLQRPYIRPALPGVDRQKSFGKLHDIRMHEQPAQPMQVNRECLPRRVALFVRPQ